MIRRPATHLALFQKYRCGTSSRAGPPCSRGSGSPSCSRDDPGLAAGEVREREVGRVAAVGERHRERALRLDPLEQGVDRDAAEARAELRPLGHAVDVAGDGREPARVELGRVPRRPRRRTSLRHPLRDQVVEARHQLPRRVGGHAARRGRPPGEYAMAHSYGGYTTNLALDDLTGGKAWVVTCTRASRCRASTAAPPAARPAPVLLEEREVGRGAAHHGPRRAGLLGGERLPQPRRPLEGGALLDD